MILPAGLPAYNLEVEDDPTYVAEGVVVHNCRELNGREIPIVNAARQRDAMMAAEDPEDVKAIAPWPKLSAIVDASDAAVLAQGVAMPPYHFNCRTTVVAKM